MKVIKPSVEIVDVFDGLDVIRKLEMCGRVCYKSEGKMNEASPFKFIQNIINRGHESVLEHFSFTVKFICDRGVSHEIVRHRIASYCQESTRYCNYSKDDFGSEITVIEPCFLIPGTKAYADWYTLCLNAEIAYFNMLDWGCSPQEARAVLPNSLKTEIVMTANIREWRHFFKLRAAKAAHPQMQQVAIPLLLFMRGQMEPVFGDIRYNTDFNLANYADVRWKE
jgi:thymidylate synthase (FAD)